MANKVQPEDKLRERYEHHGYKLQLVRVEIVPDPNFAGGTMSIVKERGAFYQVDGKDRLFNGYSLAINTAGDLNNKMKKEGKWEEGWRFHTVAV